MLIHNAGALTATRQVAPSGIELTVASQVVGPFLLTGLLHRRQQLWDWCVGASGIDPKLLP